MTRDERLKQLRNCKHCFVCIKNCYYFDWQFKESINECILCGTNNRNHEKEVALYNHIGQDFTPEYQCYRELPMAPYHYPQLSKEPIEIKNPYLIYQSARKLGIVPEYDGTEETKNQISKFLYDCETIIYKNKLDLETEEGLELLFFYYLEGKEYKKVIK